MEAVSGYVILVRFVVAPGRQAAFVDAVSRNAAASVADEPGCRRFDVLVDPSAEDEDVLLYEIYEDAAAFERHLETRHYEAFRAETRGWVTSSTVRRLEAREHHKPDAPRASGPREAT